MVADMHNAQGDNNAANAGGDVAVAANANSQEAGANQAPPAEAPAAGNAPAQAAAAAAAADSTSAAAAASTAPAAAAAAPSAASAAAADDESDDDEAETVEESPCSRWLKRKEEVRYRDVPGIDTAFLAMDSEEGVEVVWNEAQFSTTKKFKAQEDKLKNVFEALTLIEHPNIVKFHKFWTDPGSVDERTGERRLPRLIFITEYMSSGSLKQFLRRTKKNNRKIQLQSWKRWCTQILSALSYLHQTCSPTITHGNLTCDTIFIQHNGLVKIGSIAPDIIHQNVKTYREDFRNRHYFAPEFGEGSPGTPSDVYAFGMCALETAALGILTTNGEGGAAAPEAAAAAALTEAGAGSGGDPDKAGDKGAGGAGGVITEDTINRTIDLLEDNLQKDFIRRCLRKDPAERPTARMLLFHPVLFEVHSLKLLAAHSLVNAPGNINDAISGEEAVHYGPDIVMATVSKGGTTKEYKLSNVPVAEKLEKFMEDVKFGIYPITAFALAQPLPQKTRAVTPEGPSGGSVAEKKGATSSAEAARSGRDRAGGEKSVEKDGEETRRMTHAMVSVGEPAYPGAPVFLIMIVRFEDCQNRQMHTSVELYEDTPTQIVEELVQECLISRDDTDFLRATISEAFRKCVLKQAVRLCRICAPRMDIPQEVQALCAPCDEDMNTNFFGSKDEDAFQALVREAKFGDLNTYFKAAEHEVRKLRAEDPREAVKLRDFTGVSEAHPLPNGAFFCGPVAPEGSEPYRVPESTSNPFDITLLHGCIEAAGGPFDYFTNLLPAGLLPNLEPPNRQTPATAPEGSGGTGAPAVTGGGTGSGAISTPMNPSGEGGAPPLSNGGDTYQNLQNAQQVLEGLQQNQQPQQQQLQQQGAAGGNASVSPGLPASEPARNQQPPPAPEGR